MDIEDLKGMSVNERLYALSLIEAFDSAIQDTDHDKAISILQSAKLSKEQANETVQAIFKNPEKYGY